MEALAHRYQRTLTDNTIPPFIPLTLIWYGSKRSRVIEQTDALPFEFPIQQLSMYRLHSTSDGTATKSASPLYQFIATSTTLEELTLSECHLGPSEHLNDALRIRCDHQLGLYKLRLKKSNISTLILLVRVCDG
jgi:hypothetical protein